MGATTLGLSILCSPVVKLISIESSKRSSSSSNRNYTCKFHILSSILGSFLLGALLCPSASIVKAERICEHFENDKQSIAGPCDSSLCFALWNVVNGSGEPVYVKQGCWEASPQNACQQSDCVANVTINDKSHDPLKPHFCCCSADYCNGNVSVVEVEAEEEEEEKEHLDGVYAEISSADSFRTSIAAVLAVIIGLAVALVVFVGVYYAWKNQIGKHKPHESDDFEAGEKLMEPLSKSQISWEITDPIILGEEIAKGKFATVCSGRIGGMEVALKVFSADEREYFENEKFIFSILGNKKHILNSCLIKYHGWQEFSVESSTSLILALDRIRPGNLRDFLIASENNSLSITSVLKIMSDISTGLAYLHGENADGVVIAHRDLATKNILIDEHLNCYISDFGLSLLTTGSSYFWAGRERQAEFCSLAEAGTKRYMAPELLEGAVNLKDCENALKQADIYALALILWEVANLSHDIALPSHCRHRLPYEQEIGKDICMESLARYVVNRRDRPSFSGWRDTPISRNIRDTLNESWDPEPDARLTALCVQIRFAELHHNKNTANDSITPLEAPPTSPWAGRNPCAARNLLEENSEDKSTEYLLTSEKHLIPKGPSNNSRIMFMSGGSVSSGDQSSATTNTDLSNSVGSAQNHPLHMPNPPNPIPFVQNLLR